jgi:hypothetical protein
MPRGRLPVCLAFQFPTLAEVDATFAELTTAGYRGLRAPWDAFWAPGTPPCSTGTATASTCGVPAG